MVLETDSPDIPPHWLYRTAEQRASGMAQGRNEPAELPRIAQVLAQLRGIGLDELAMAADAQRRRSAAEAGRVAVSERLAMRSVCVIIPGQ